MDKKGVNVPAIITAVVAVCIIALAAVLGIKLKNDSESSEIKKSKKVNNSESDTETVDYDYYDEQYSNEEYSFSIPEDTDSTASIIDDISSTVTDVVTSTVKSVKEKTTKKASTATTEAETVVVDGTNIPVVDEEDTSKSSGATVKEIQKEEASSGELDQDMYFSGLYKLGYDVIGPKGFIYNDDTAANCAQRNFGYNKLYDAGASLIDFSIETVRIKFNYDNKQYMVQMWKGQYISGDIGTVGGEIGIYTRDAGKTYIGSHYDCASESDWLNMELTCLWDENDDGNYIAQFTRKYALHWWETGYVDGQLKDRNDSSPLRLLHRITFKDETQAKAFENAMISAGFKSVSTFNPTVKDTVKRQGKDVIYVWQDVR